MSELHTAADDARRTLELLFDEHRLAVFRYVSRRAPDAFVDDIVAETFLVAWRRRDAVPADPLPWLLGVARRTLATQQRSSLRRSALITKLTASAPVTTREAAFDGTPEDQPVIEALRRLRPVDQEAIMLVAWDELTPAQAAAALGQTAVAFRVRLHRAKRRLRNNLLDDDPQPNPMPLPTLEEAEC